eukprot:6485748-Pyramimonas_sp.AAC.1
MERPAAIPMHIPITIMALIAKLSSGCRPIGIVCSAFRMYGKLRRPLADELEARYTRDYFWRWAVRGHRTSRGAKPVEPRPAQPKDSSAPRCLLTCISTMRPWTSSSWPSVPTRLDSLWVPRICALPCIPRPGSSWPWEALSTGPTGP